MKNTIAKQSSDINTTNGDELISHEKKSCENNSIDYSLSDLELKLNEISSISLFLSTGNCPKAISYELHDHMHAEIERLQSMLCFIRLAPSVRENMKANH